MIDYNKVESRKRRTRKMKKKNDESLMAVHTCSFRRLKNCAIFAFQKIKEEDNLHTKKGRAKSSLFVVNCLF